MSALPTYRSRRLIDPTNINSTGTMQCYFLPRLGDKYPKCFLKIANCNVAATSDPVMNNDDYIYIGDYIKKLTEIKNEIEAYIGFIAENEVVIQELYLRCDKAHIRSVSEY